MTSWSSAFFHMAMGLNIGNAAGSLINGNYPFAVINGIIGLGMLAMRIHLGRKGRWR